LKTFRRARVCGTHTHTSTPNAERSLFAVCMQDGEAGGITQQIGATFFPIENLKKETMKIPRAQKIDHKIPGMLIIDTPGHESFSNLRTRGSGLCDIAILVVDIMHGLEPQTIESINLLKMRKTPFIVALNKVDRCYDWTECPNMPIRQALKEQKEQTKQEFEDRLAKTLVLFAEQEINAIEYWKNEDLNEYVSVVPTSAISGEGVPDLLLLLVEYTQTLCLNSVMYHPIVECTVLEVKVIEGLGTTIDVVLVNGNLHEKDTIVVCGLNGAIVTQVRALLTPQPMKELRVKNAYMHHEIIRGAQGIKISAPGLEEAIAGSALMVVRPQDDIDDIKEEIIGDLDDMLSNIEKTGRGVYVQASTLGSLEALLEFLRTSKIPVSGISIGPVHRKDVVKASAQLEFRAMYAAIMAFDVDVDPEAKAMADKIGVKIFTADIIYHLFDQFTAYLEELHDKAKAEAAEKVVFPCRLKVRHSWAQQRSCQPIAF
jgi:translation initiation factor 5B